MQPFRNMLIRTWHWAGAWWACDNSSLTCNDWCGIHNCCVKTNTHAHPHTLSLIQAKSSACNIFQNYSCIKSLGYLCPGNTSVHQLHSQMVDKSPGIHLGHFTSTSWWHLTQMSTYFFCNFITVHTCCYNSFWICEEDELEWRCWNL